ncbi:MAG: hypothetical protein ACOX79_11850 [Methanosarcina sp.]
MKRGEEAASMKTRKEIILRERKQKFISSDKRQISNKREGKN